MTETKKNPKNPGADVLNSVFKAISEPLKAVLSTSSAGISHPSAKGEASEFQWLQWLRTYLPRRYEVDKGFVIDSDGNVSEQQDIIIYDRQYSPYLLNKDGMICVPAESVYAVLEVKQSLSRAHIKYSGQKIESVRCLKRTSVQIAYAGGMYEAKPPQRIIGGLVCLNSVWKKGFPASIIRNALETVKDKVKQIDLICCLTVGSLEVSYKDDRIELKASTPEGALIFFFIELLSALQNIGTVPAIDFNAYLTAFENVKSL